MRPDHLSRTIMTPNHNVHWRSAYVALIDWNYEQYIAPLDYKTYTMLQFMFTHIHTGLPLAQDTESKHTPKFY